MGGKMKKIQLLVLFLSLITTNNSFGSFLMKDTPGLQQEQKVEFGNMNKDQIIATLKNDIKVIDEQMAQCKKQKKGWTAATVIGGLGIIGTGINAIVKNNQIKDKKTELKGAQDELRSLK